MIDTSTVREPVTLDRITGTVTYFGFRTLATIAVTDSGGLSSEAARLALYCAILDGRSRISDKLASAIDLIGPTPRIREPGSSE